MKGLKELREWLSDAKENRPTMKFKRECQENCLLAAWLNETFSRIYRVTPYNIYAFEPSTWRPCDPLVGENFSQVFPEIDPKIILSEINVHELTLFVTPLDRTFPSQEQNLYITVEQALDFLEEFSQSPLYLIEYPQGIGG